MSDKSKKHAPVSDELLIAMIEAATKLTESIKGEDAALAWGKCFTQISINIKSIRNID